MSTKQSSVNVLMEAKFIVDELNALFQKNYNMLSLDGMSRIEMLQLISNVLKALEVLDNPITVTNESTDQAVLDILQALNSIKYVPETTDDPTEFRNGLAMANQNITHSILHWLLSNKSQVKRRAYISKFVEKVPIPPEMLQDPQLEQLNNNYDKATQEFWKAYQGNKDEKKNANNAKELQFDIQKMTSDLQNLGQLLQKQKDKVCNISSKEAYTIAVKSLLAETNNNKRLEDQLKNIQESLTNQESEIKTSREALNMKKLSRPTKSNIIEQVSEELHINKILTDTQLPEEIETVENELQIHETVAFEADPIQFDIDSLDNDMENLTVGVKTLVGQKIALTNTGTDNLGPFRNQATIIANKKQEISSKVIELKSNLDKLYETIGDKKQMLYSLVGGEVLHGEELKQFISKLRERSVIYKEYRSRLHSLTEELSLLGRTYDILLLFDPTISTTEQSTQSSTQSEAMFDLQGAKMKVRMLTQTCDATKTEAAQAREELNNMRAIMQNVIDTYDQVLKEFEESTGFLTTKIEEIIELKETLGNEIKKKEDNWKKIRVDLDKYENILVKLGDDMLNVSGETSVPMIEQYQQLLEAENKRLENLEMDLANSDETKNINELQLEIIRKLRVLLSSIWDEEND